MTHEQNTEIGDQASVRYSMPMMKHNRKMVIISVSVSVIVIGILAAAYASLSPTASSTKDRGLIFNDDFNGDTLDSKKWVTCYDNYSNKYGGCTNYGNWENEWYTASQVKVDGGTLILTANRHETQGDNSYGTEQSYPYVSGMISSGNLNKTSPAKWGATYGYFEARVFIPSGKAIWPAFWLLPTDASWPPEIDVMEVLGDKPNRLLNTYFWKDAQGAAAKDSGTYTAASSLSEGWHTYGVDWQKGKLAWYLDGKLVRNIRSKNVPSQPMHLLLNLAVGGTLPGYPDKTTPDSVQMLVDYVRAYRTIEDAQR